MEVFDKNKPYIFISYAHSDSETVLPIIDYMQKAGIHLWYDAGIEAGTEWPEYIAEHLAGASCILVFLSPNSANSKNCRNEINLAAELKKEFLVVHLKDFELSLGLKLQLNSNQAIYRPRFRTDAEFLQALVNAQILQRYRSNFSETQAVFTPPEPSAKTKKAPKALIIILPVVALLTVIFVVILAFGGNHKDGENISDSPAFSTVILDYDLFYETLIAASEKLGCDSMWDPTELVDNYHIEHDDGDVWTTYYTNSFTLEGISLHIGFCNDGVEIMMVLNSFQEQDLDTAYALLECLSSAVHGYTFTDFEELMTDESRDPWENLGTSRSLWQEVLGAEEYAFGLYDDNTTMETYYKQLSAGDIRIHIERRSRIYNGTTYYDFTVLYDHKDNI